MPDTVVGLLIVVVAVLPGAVYTWALERQTGGWGLNLADRTLRFISSSLIFHLLAAWPEYLLYRWALDVAQHHTLRVGQFAAIWAGFALLVAVPATIGTVLGGLYATRGSRSGWSKVRRWIAPGSETRLLQRVLGRAPAPRGWDNFFSESPVCFLRVRTTDGTLLAGLFADKSYAAGFPQEPDLFLEQAYGVDDETGELTNALGYALYVPAAQIAWMEVVPSEGATKGAVDG